jgi:hypothetical protein
MNKRETCLMTKGQLARSTPLLVPLILWRTLWWTMCCWAIVGPSYCLHSRWAVG